MQTERGKAILYIAISVVLIVVAYGIISYVRTYSRSIEPSSFRSFSVSGEGKVVAKPDVAQFSFSVVTQGGKDIGALQKDNTERVNRAIALAKTQGVEDKDIKTEYYSVEPRYQYFSCPPTPIYDTRGIAQPCPPSEIVGYTVSQTVQVKIRNFDKTGDILSGVVTAGANSVSQLFFTIDDPAALESEARTQAIEEAQKKAEAIATAGKFSIGRLLAIEEGGYLPPVYFRGTEAMGKGGDAVMASPAPTVEPGSQEIRVTVTMRYEID